MATVRADFKQLTKKSNEIVDWIAGLIKPFGWIARHVVLSSDQLNKLQGLRDIVEENTLSASTVPEIFWTCVRMPDRCTPPFRNLNDAAALAIALTPTVDSLFNWIGEQAGVPDDLIAEALQALPEQHATPSGTVFAESTESGTAVWFGSKASRLDDERIPALTGAETIAAVRSLFLLPPVGEQTCRVCGCTEDDCRECIEATGEPCHWIEIDLCSRCAASKHTGDRQGVSPPNKPVAVDYGTASEELASPRTAAPQKKQAAKKVRGLTAAAAPAGKTPAGQSDSKLLMVPIADIRAAENNHRKTFDQPELQALAESIRQHGILQPLLLRPLTPVEGRMRNINFSHAYEIVAGERRWRAAKLAGLAEVPAQISERDGLQRSLAMFEENIRRVDLSPIERAQAIQRLIDEHKLTQKEVGKIIGVQQGQISNELRLLNLPPVWQQRIATGKIAPTLIRPLLPYCDLPTVLEAIEVEQSEGDDPLDEVGLKNLLKTAILANSRPMKFASDWQAFQKPDRNTRHFKTCSPEDLKALQPRKIDLLSEWEGQERTFNCELFDQLNKTPLAARLEKHKKHAAERKSVAGPTDSKNVKFIREFKEFQLAGLVKDQLTAAMISAISDSKDSLAVTRAVLVLAISGQLDRLFGCRWDGESKYFKAIVAATADSKQWAKELVRRLRASEEERFDTECIHQLAELLGVNLVADWQPTKDLLELLTDAGLLACVAATGLTGVRDTREGKIAALLKDWPPGLIPDFMYETFGLPNKPAKAAKKAKGAA